MIDFEKHCQTLSDAELDYLRQDSTPANLKIVLKEIHRRQEIKEQNVNNTQKSIKNLTVIILVFTFLSLVILAIQFFSKFFASNN